MEGYLLILLFALLDLGETMIYKAYGKKYSSGGMLMNAVIALFAGLFFLITDTGGFYAPVEMIPLACINMLLYATGFYLTFLSFKIGPYGLTRLILSFSLIMPIFYGLFFLDEETTPLTYIGIALVFAAMFLINFSPKESSKKSDEEGFSIKWLICIIASTLANGFIAILVRMQQLKFDNACSNEYQMISYAGAFILLALIGFITERKNLKSVIKSGLVYGIGAGLCNGVKDFTLIFAYLFLPISTVEPLRSSLSMIGAFLVSLMFYKEKYSRMQKIGILLGAAAVVILTL